MDTKRTGGSKMKSDAISFHAVGNKIFRYSAMLLLSAAAFAEAPLFMWGNDDLKDITFSAQCGNTAAMKINTEIKTPDGQNTVEVSSDKFLPDSKVECIQLNYNYSGGLKAGKTYEVTFLCRGSTAGQMQLIGRQSISPWDILKGSDRRILISNEWQVVKLIFTAQKDWN